MARTSIDAGKTGRGEVPGLVRTPHPVALGQAAPEILTLPPHCILKMKSIFSKEDEFCRRDADVIRFVSERNVPW
ncbi:hypothetical protein [Azospirillum argentinense]